MPKPLLPTSNLAKRLCDIMHRRHSTPWLLKTVRAFRLIKDHVLEDDLLMVERYYKSNWPPNIDKNILRHDFDTFINHFFGEVDRARIWCERHPIKSVRKIIQMPPTKSEQPFVLTHEEEANVGKFMAQFAVFKKVKSEMGR